MQKYTCKNDFTKLFVFVSHSGISGRTFAETLMALKFPGVSQQTQKYAELSVPTSPDVSQRALTAQVSPHTHILHTYTHTHTCIAPHG